MYRLKKIKLSNALSHAIVIIFLSLSSIFFACGPDYEYTGDINFTKFTWLTGKKIFLDPGHGGSGDSDLFRIGPGGITEEEVVRDVVAEVPVPLLQQRTA